MSDGLPVKRKLWDRLRDTYRISILDDENLEEVGSYNLSLLSFYIFISVVALLLSTLVISFIIFTPVKRLIPGYGDITDNKKFIELSKKVDNLEEEISAYDTYIGGLKTMLTGGIYNSSVERIDSLADRKNIRPELINQEDMAGTLMSFSSLIFEGLSVLGIELEPFEKEAYIHCWRVIGHMIGLDDDLIPKNSADAVKLGNRILEHQMANSPQGSELMKSLLDYQDTTNKKSDPINNISTFRYMMGHKLSDMLDIPQVDQSHIDKLSVKYRRITRIMELLDHSLIFAMLIQWVSKLGINLVIKKMTKANIINFYLPKSLTQDWNFKRTN